MKKRIFLKRISYIGFLVLLVSLFFMGVQQVQAKVVIKAVQSGWIGHPQFNGWEAFVKKINKKAKGELTIKVIGGPDVMPRGEQAKAVRDGIVDMVALYGAMACEIVPAYGPLSVTTLTIGQLREKGVMDMLYKESEKKGILFLGPYRIFPSGWGHMFIYLKKPVKSVAELKGLRIACGSMPGPWVKALGMTRLKMPPADRYTAMERGIADGAANSLEGAYGASYFEVAKYWIDHAAYGIDHWILMNPKKFKSLPTHLQKLIKNTARDMEPEFEALTKEIRAEARKGSIKGGMKPIKFEPAEAKKLIDIAMTSRWKWAAKKYPGIAPTLKPMLQP
jgi:TRAP-type C4-dicarboxylate transport system substrate-binding protein